MFCRGDNAVSRRELLRLVLRAMVAIETQLLPLVMGERGIFVSGYLQLFLVGLLR